MSLLFSISLFSLYIPCILPLLLPYWIINTNQLLLVLKLGLSYDNLVLELILSNELQKNDPSYWADDWWYSLGMRINKTFFETNIAYLFTHLDRLNIVTIQHTFLEALRLLNMNLGASPCSFPHTRFNLKRTWLPWIDLFGADNPP